MQADSQPRATEYVKIKTRDKDTSAESEGRMASQPFERDENGELSMTQNSAIRIDEFDDTVTPRDAT